MPPTTDLPTFIARWQSAGGAERADAQLFITELCDLLNPPFVGPSPGMPIPRLAPSPRKPAERKKGHRTRGVKMWDDALLRAKSQGENYVRNIPDDQLLEELAALNHQRTEEDESGTMRCLRPEFQKP